MKEDSANSTGLGGIMVWALDLDDPKSSSSLGNLALNGLRSIGDAVDANPTFAAQKLAATQFQNNVQLTIFWTKCDLNPICPDGFYAIAIGHGKVSTANDGTRTDDIMPVFDAELGIFTGDGCQGDGNGYDRALCVKKNVKALNYA